MRFLLWVAVGGVATTAATAGIDAAAESEPSNILANGLPPPQEEAWQNESNNNNRALTHEEHKKSFWSRLYGSGGGREEEGDDNASEDKKTDDGWHGLWSGLEKELNPNDKKSDQGDGDVWSEIARGKVLDKNPGDTKHEQVNTEEEEEEDEALDSHFPPPVEITVFFEAICQSCKLFLLQELIPTYWKLGPKVMNITLVPFGNARIVSDDPQDVARPEPQHQQQQPLPRQERQRQRQRQERQRQQRQERQRQQRQEQQRHLLQQQQQQQGGRRRLQAMQVNRDQLLMMNELQQMQHLNGGSVAPGRGGGMPMPPNAQETVDDSDHDRRHPWKPHRRVECPHGNGECHANALLQCLFEALPRPDDYMPILQCLEGAMPVHLDVVAADPSTLRRTAERCANAANKGMEFRRFMMRKCYDDPLQSWRLQLQAFRQTPPPSERTHLPWIQLAEGRPSSSPGGQHLRPEIFRGGDEELDEAICRIYNSQRPEGITATDILEEDQADGCLAMMMA